MSAQNPNPAPIIVVKKKVAGHGHHGGAWKVAYADFVTAMMALFIVLWLMNTNDQVKRAVAGYFRDPSGRGSEQGTGQAGLGESIGISKDDMGKLREKLEAAMKQMPELAALKDQVRMTVTGEGLRIELLEKETGTFFESGNAEPTGPGREMLEMLAAELNKLPNKLLIEGHTDARPFSGNKSYSNWELSVDRANAARKLMESVGLRPGQVDEVRGYADRRLLKPGDPNHPSNRRISIIVKYSTPPAPAAPEPPAGQAAAQH
jgi:chemotaxis protein MotB